MTRPKITIVGTGMVGTMAAFMAAVKNLGDLVLVDIDKGLAAGKALDLQEAMPILESDITVIGTNNYRQTNNSDIVVVTAGLPRKPGMTRDDLLITNAKIITSIIPKVVKHSPRCFLIIVTNPLDAMVYLAKKLSKFPRNRIMGMAGILDSTRFRTFIAQEVNVAYEDTTGFVLGGHGDTMVPLARYSTVAGTPITELLPKKTIDRLVDRTRKGGGEIVNLLKKGSAFSAPGVSVIEMVDAILKDRKRELPCAAELHGEYGVHGLFIGVPVVLGSKGVEKIIKLRLNKTESAMFKKTVNHVRELSKKIDKLFPTI